MNTGNNRLKRDFFLKNTLYVARNLLGKIIVRQIGGQTLTGMIVETEAYIGDHDPACHAFGKFTGRASVLYEKGGIVYVYFIYGNYYCFNLVTEDEGRGCAVLIRAVEPIEGIDIMRKLRPETRNIYELTNGPSKFCIAFGIDKELNRKDSIDGNEIYVCKPYQKYKFEVSVSNRIGLKSGTELPYRFFIKDNPYVSKHKFNIIK